MKQSNVSISDSSRMKTKYTLLLLAIICIQFSVAQVGIGTTNPNPSAQLDITSSNSGLVIPRLTTAQRNAIASPVTSLLIYNSTTDCLEMFAATGQWVSLGCGCQLPGAFATTNASGILATGFTANWNLSAGANAYFLDVSTVSNFATFVPGFNNINVGNVSSYNVAGLTCNTNYFYRIRANNTCGTSANSNTISVLTSTCSSCIDGTGGIITHVGGNTIHTFLSSGTFTPGCAENIKVLVVAGGGGGGTGGGGAGGLIYNAAFPVAVASYGVTVGSGGNGGIGSPTYSAGMNGGNSVFSTLTAIGGGGGAFLCSNGLAGGSGGGGASCGNTTVYLGGNGTAGQGNKGGNNNGINMTPYYPGGGGGAGAVGANGTGSASGVGGIGLSYAISGIATYYSGGGGGGIFTCCGGGAWNGALGGLGGGGNSGNNVPPTNGVSGTPNTGGGGGGTGDYSKNGGAGGSGIVIISYPSH